MELVGGGGGGVGFIVQNVLLKLNFFLLFLYF